MPKKRTAREDVGWAEPKPDPDDPSGRLLSRLAVGGTWVASDLPGEMAHDLALLLYTLYDYGELEWPLI